MKGYMLENGSARALHVIRSGGLYLFKDSNRFYHHTKEYLPSECENIVDTLQFECDIDKDEYLEQALEDEAEDEMEM